MHKDELIKVIIVDDSYLVRNDIKASLDWQKLGFKIVGEASNGKQCIDLYDKIKADLIITDIRMPVLDGLGMIDELLSRKEYPEFILLTAYEDFEYARKAIKFNVVNYILKHEINEDLFLNALMKTKDHILSSRAKKAKEINREAEDLLLRGAKMGGEPEILCPYYSNGKVNYAFVIIHYAQDSGKPEEEIQREIGIPSGRFAQDAAIVCEFYDSPYYIFCLARKEASNLTIVCTSLAKELILADEQNQSIISVLVGGNESDPTRFVQAYETARDASRCDFFLCSDKKLFYSWELKNREYDIEEVSRLTSSMEESLRLGNMSKSVEYINVLCDLCNKSMSIDCFNFIKENMNRSLPKYLGDSFAAVRRAKSVDDFFKQTIEMINGFYADCDVGIKTREVLKYINSNLEKDISLEDIAEIMKVSPVYAGKLFKKELGISFNKYLMQVRIERAKALLKSGDYKIYEISTIVGYNTVQYFSSIFKKATGVSPKDYC